MKQLTRNQYAYYFGDIVCLLTHIRNGVNGNPRFEATLIYRGVAKTFRFDGHFREDSWEAQWIVNEKFTEIVGDY